ncbi:hypothetical protein D9M71_449750 [compost metagenome]
MSTFTSTQAIDECARWDKVVGGSDCSTSMSSSARPKALQRCRRPWRSSCSTWFSMAWFNRLKVVLMRWLLTLSSGRQCQFDQLPGVADQRE